MKYPRLITVILLLCSIGFLSFHVYRDERERRMMKEDLIELSKIKYGLFSVDEWKLILAGIVTKKLDEFKLEDASKEEMRRKVSELLNKLVSDFEVRYREKKSQQLLGFIEGGLVSMMGAFEQIKEDIPELTEQILDFMNDPENKATLRRYLITKYVDRTSASIDYSMHDYIISHYDFMDRADAICGLNEKLDSLDHERRPYTISLLVLAALAMLYTLFIKGLSKTEYLILTLVSLFLLLTGLLLPMIELDARISAMSFTLFGEPVNFQDQVLYYRSKSILEVVRLLLTQGSFDLLAVGVLIFTFSVLFPLSKLIATMLYFYFPHRRSNRLIQFTVFKTGKWSMADVMVIAIFMAFIGFSGIITEQLTQVENITPNIDILTTNMSCLRIGFFAFTAFAVLSLLIAHRLQYEMKNGLNGERINKVVP